MILASKHFSIERLTQDDLDLRVSFNCLNCGFTSICDLYEVSLELCLHEHLQSCPNGPDDGYVDKASNLISTLKLKGALIADSLDRFASGGKK
jgi:hypothetical protein